MQVRGVPILGEGGCIREWVGVHADIDAAKRAEAATQEARLAAEAAMRETPSQAISGWSIAFPNISRKSTGVRS